MTQVTRFNAGQSRGGHHAQQYGSSAEPPPIDFSEISFFEIDDDLFDGIAQNKAKEMYEDGHWLFDSKRKSWSRKNNLQANKSSQLRKFYDELVMWYDKVFVENSDHRNAKYKELAPFIKMLCAKVTYARGRNHVSDGFEKLFIHVIRSVNSPDTLRNAKLFIEAFMGFYKATEKLEEI